MISREAKTTFCRFFALIAVVAVAVLSWTAFSFAFARKAHAEDTGSARAADFDHASATALSAMDDKPESGAYYLTDDVVLTKTWELYSDETISLCLHGHSVTCPKNTVFGVYGSAVLNIYDCGGEENCGAISGGKGVYLYNGGTLNMYGGAIKEADGVSSGVSVSGNAVFNMYGG
ncbi:MAG: hypothetical protein K2M48_01470 [Clostridiales bacterium]|nr:hypothetical protein [Clostridiales bacterium]